MRLFSEKLYFCSSFQKKYTLYGLLCFVVIKSLKYSLLKYNKYIKVSLAKLLYTIYVVDAIFLLHMHYNNSTAYFHILAWKTLKNIEKVNDYKFEKYIQM